MRVRFASNTDGRTQLVLEADPGAESLLFHHWLKEMRAGDLPITVMHLGGSNETGQHFTIGCYPPYRPEGT